MTNATIDINDVDVTEVGQTYVDGDILIQIRAKAVKVTDEGKMVEMAYVTKNDIATGKVTESHWSVVETDKDGDVVESDDYDNAEDATFSYVERAFGINC